MVCVLEINLLGKEVFYFQCTLVNTTICAVFPALFHNRFLHKDI